jgi:AraC-like DNA-binding protein
MVPFYEFQPSDITIIHNQREIKYKPHIHEQIEILYVFKVGQHINIGGRDFEVKEHEAAIIFPDIVHTYYRNEQRGTDQMLVICSQKLFNGVFPDLNRFYSEDPIITELDDTVRLAFKELSECSEFSERLAWTILILSRLIKHIKLNRKSKGNEPIESLTQKIVTYIGRNFREDITLDQLASEFSVSKFYISHTFSEKIKISLPNYLALIRAEYAAGLIRTTNDSITNICANSGFSSQSTFNRAFKRLYNMTPREYKNNIGELYKA